MKITKLTSKFGWEGDGGVGDKLIEQILAGAKTATACPKLFYTPKDLEELYLSVGQLITVTDKDDRPHCVIRQLAVFETSFGKPDPRLVFGEACASAEEFRQAHEHVWDDLFAKAASSLRDDTVLIAELFELAPGVTP